MDVGLFITCLNDTFYPRVGAAVVGVLRHFGCEVHFPAGQTCCGQPAYNNGLMDEAARFVGRMIDVFEPFGQVVSPSASCVNMLKFHGPGLFEPGTPKRRRAEQLAGRLFEFTDFLTDVLGIDLSGLIDTDAVGAGETATYHYSCHTRGLATAEQRLATARRLLGECYVPLERADQCCGFGGAFAMEHDGISGAMVADKHEQIRESGAKLLICDEAGCRMNIAGRLHHCGESIRVLHSAELIAEALNIPLPEAS